MTIAEDLARFAIELKPSDIPHHVREDAALHLLDAFGCGLAAYGAGFGDEALQIAIEDGGAQDATAIGHRGRLPAPAAAMANGTLIHCLDYDDTHSDSVCHISTVVVPAAVAAAEANLASGSDLLAALIVGNEIVARVGMAAASEFHDRGFHPTSLCGIFGATAAAARLYHLDPHQTVHALGIAGSMSSGVLECLSDGSSTKRQHPGWAAHSGLIAARLAQAGATGPATIFEGRFGLYNAYLSQDKEDDLRTLVATIGSIWETPNIAFKPFPACHFVHACLDAASVAAKGLTLSPGDIERIVVSIPAAGVPIVLEPRDRKLQPSSGYEAKFSLQFCVAAMLIRETVDLTTFEIDSVRDPEILSLANKVTYEGGHFPTYPDAFPGSVRIETSVGILESELPYQRGGPENPMASDQVKEKFKSNAAYALQEEDASKLASDLVNIEALPHIADVIGTLGTAHPQPVGAR